MRTIIRSIFVALLTFSSASVSAAETIRIAFIDALSGPYADLGFAGLKQYQEAIAYANTNGGALSLKLELVPLDDKSSIEQALANLALAIQQGMRYVAQGNNPEITLALVEAINAHNLKNPSRAVLLLNYGDGAPELGQEQCSFWHFRFDASFAMKLQALVTEIPVDGDIAALYFLNQDDVWGHNASREALRIFTRLRPDIQIVGDDVHPVGGGADFPAYFAKIAESGANAVLTADRGADLIAMMEAADKAEVQLPIFVVGNSNSTVPTAIRQSGAGRVHSVFTWHSNIGANQLDQFANAYRKNHNQEWNGLASYLSIQMLVTAMETARSLEPLKVARVLEGLSYLGVTGPTAMREDNHQLLQPLFVATLAKASGDGVKHSVADTGLGWKTTSRKEMEQTFLETTCKMQRPSLLKKNR